MTLDEAYAVVIEDMRQKRACIDDAISALESIAEWNRTHQIAVTDISKRADES